MKKEYEIRIYDFDEKKVKQLIKKNGGKLLQKKTIMKTITYHHPKKKDDIFIRLRDEGKNITLTVKTNLKSKYKVEREIIVDSMDEAEVILKLLDCTEKYRNEKIRETYIIKGCKEIVFDSSPGLPTWLEIDCHNEKSLKSIVKILGFTLNDNAGYGVAERYYRLYKIKKDIKIINLTFKNANKILSKYIKKNKNQFNKILKNQLKLKF
jgi:adenylate cyclase class IV